MKKIFKDIDKKFIVSLLIIICLLSTYAVAYAIKVTAEMDSKGSEGSSITTVTNFDDKYLFLKDLKDRYDIICCYHGGNNSHLANPEAATLYAGGYSTTVTDSGKEIGRLTKADEGAQTALTIEDSTSSTSPFTDGSYTAESWAYYEVVETVVTSPDNSYILAEMVSEVPPDNNVFYGDGYSTVQYAWWVTDDNHGTNHSTINSLYEEAEAFNTYITEIAESTDVSKFVETSYSFEDDYGEIHAGIVPAPVLNYNPEYNLDANQDGIEEADENGNPSGKDKVTVTFDSDTNTWTVGPFSIDYVESSYFSGVTEGVDARDPIQFAGITNAQLYLVNSEGALVEIPFAIKEDEEGIENPIQEIEGAKWKFNFLKDQRELTDVYRFPHANEVFYIEIEYMEDMVAVGNLHFDFKYMNAGGQYDKLDGTYYTQTWTPNSEVSEYCSGGYSYTDEDGTSHTVLCSHGKYSRHPIKWNYWLDLTGMEAHTAQLLAYGIIGARWYEDASLDLKFEEKKSWGYTITKEVYDENGNKLETDDKFVFNVYKDGEFYDCVAVKGNTTLGVSGGKIGIDEPFPNITIEEVLEGEDAENYKVLDISSEVNETGNSKSFKFTAKNEAKPRDGQINIIKHFDGAYSEEFKNIEFCFNIFVDGKLYTDSRVPDGVIKIRPEQTWSTERIKYYGQTPKYEVREIGYINDNNEVTKLPEWIESRSITNKKGYLGTDVKVEANNYLITEEGSLTIKKVTTDEIDTDETFNIKVTIGDKVQNIKLGVNDVWSTTESWRKGMNPSYSVEEIELPEGWKLVDITNKSGKLQAGTNIEVIITNEGDFTGNLSVEKIIENSDITQASDIFEFEIKVSGNFTYKDKTYKNETMTEVVKIKSGQKYLTADFKWKGNAPTYEVTEINIPEIWKLKEIRNAKGKLIDKKTCEVVAINTKETGKTWNYIIYKKVVDEEGNKLSTDDMFTFNVFKNGTLFETVQVAGNSKYESKDFKLSPKEEYPEIKIEEVLEGDNYKLIGIESSENENGDTKTFKFKATNQKGPKEGEIVLIKHFTGPYLEKFKNVKFKFKLYVDEKLLVIPGKTTEDGIIEIIPEQEWKSGPIKYYDNAPKYRIEEIEIPEGVQNYQITNKEGVLGDYVVVEAYNREDLDKGTITIRKMLEAGSHAQNELFTVRLTVGDKVFEKQLKAGEVWKESFEWFPGEAPSYKVEEINVPEGWQWVSTNPEAGTLEKDANIKVVITNRAETEKRAKIAILKEIETNDKIGVDNNLSFNFIVRVSGTFEYGDESYSNSTMTIPVTVKPNEKWTMEHDVVWKGEDPTYEVEEVNIPEGWMVVSHSNSSGILKDGKEYVSRWVNKNGEIIIDLTMEMSGIVWEDAPLNEEDKNTPDSKPNGKYDDSENGIKNVEVLIWKVLYNGQTEISRSLAVGYEEDLITKLQFPIYTTTDGIWRAPKISVPGLTEEEKVAGATRADFDVEFVYDGQTYKPTDFLVTGSPLDFKTGNNARRNQYNRDSMAIEDPNEREAFDNKFAVITGDTPIADDGKTEGYAIGTNGERTELLYNSTDSIPSLDGNTRKISELQTLKDEFIRDQFKMPSRTSTGGLTWPFDKKIHLEYIEKYIDKITNMQVQKYHYSATYPYLLNINLGLVKRDEAELALTKDVSSANVVVNQKLMNYKFNEYIDFENEKYQDYLNLQLKIADANIAYKLDLYESDYYYRAKVYEGNEVYGALQEFYNTLGKTNLSDELDLDVFLTYRIGVYNNSDSYLAQIKQLTDYFDEDLELVETKVSRYIQEANGVIVDKETEVATPAYVIKKGPTSDSMWAEQLKKSIEGKISVDYATKYNSLEEITNNASLTVSDNVRSESGKAYYKSTIDLSDADLTLAVGEKLELYLTFKVRTDEAPARFGDSAGLSEAVKSYVRLGSKANVAEIGAYTTYYADSKKVAGKVDKDSAPNNVDIQNKNEKTWYEDDADSAPIITLDLYTETRNVNGMAWEDKETESIDFLQRIGDGIYKTEDGEEPVGNITTQMVEKVRVEQASSAGTYKEYDFVWPTSKTFDFLNGKTLEEITGFDSITLTSNRAEDTGMYYFKNIPAGNYVVRFMYGNFPYDDMDNDGNLVMLGANSEAKTLPYETDRKPEVYNGQDFKSTKYQANTIGDDGKTANVSNNEGYIDNEWYDFNTCQYDDAGNIMVHSSDAIDNEARRLEVIAYSRVLDHNITKTLATANDYSLDHTELYKQTNMFADTAKINLNIENMHNLQKQSLEGDTVAGGVEVQDGVKVNYTYGKSDVNGDKGTINIINYTYNVEGVDFGLEERSNTELVLDKEIESITLTPNTAETPILKAVYDISYDYELDNATGKAKYKAIVKLNDEKSFGTEHLLAQNKDEEAGLQNFRYIYYDDTIAQALNLEVNYKFTALDVGEVDRANAFVENSTPEELIAKAQEIKEQTYIKVDGKLTSVKHPKIGEFIGSMYYIGKNNAYNQSDIVVTTTVRQLIDYVDNDAVFKSEDNTNKNTSWKSVTPDELSAKKAIDENIIGEYNGVKNIVDDKGVVYSTTGRNNLILSVDSIDGNELANPGFITKLVPFSASKQNNDLDEALRVADCEAAMNLIMTRSIDSEIDDEDLSYDNIAEIIKFENTVGKRDIETIAGNADPKQGEFTVSLAERDASATELITFTPPTGLNTNTALAIQMLIVSAVALVILAIGIVIIKKTVLKK